MDYRLWIFIFLKICVRNVQCAEEEPNVQPCDGVVNEISYGNYEMKENNHNYTGAVCLISIVDEGGTGPEIQMTNRFVQFVAQDPDTGRWLMYANQSFDYDTGDEKFGFAVKLAQEFLPVELKIINYDDERPTIESPNCNFDEDTIYTASDVNNKCRIQVRDIDGMGMPEMEFTFVDEKNMNMDTYFDFKYAVTPADNAKEAEVSITVIQKLNYDEVTFFSFEVYVTDPAEHSSDKVRGLIYVTNLDLRPPEWTKYFTNTTVQEKITSELGNVKAVDGDKGINMEINYRIEEDEKLCDPGFEDTKFCLSIDTTTGAVSVWNIDRDKYDLITYEFTIGAYQIDDMSKTADPMVVTLYIEDIDDNPPIIEWVSYDNGETDRANDTRPDEVTISFLENFSGTIDMSIFVRDIDTGENAQFFVELQDPTEQDYLDPFLIVPTAGYRSGTFEIPVRNNSKLDYEREGWSSFSIEVVTTGKLNPSFTDTLKININLIDYNDELPIFPESSYSCEVNETIGINEFLIQVKATDRDAEDIELKHVLVGSTVTDLIRIDEVEGNIYVDQEDAFDYDKINPLFFQVQAIDKANHITTVPVTINLLDVNNKAPTIEVDRAIFIEENQLDGLSFNVTIKASDVDTTGNLTAEIKWDESYVSKNFQRLEINNCDEDNPDDSDGCMLWEASRFLSLDIKDEFTRNIIIDLVTTNCNEVKPDYETFDSLFMVLEVTDLNTDEDFLDKKSTKQTILINIVDINDNPPEWDESSFEDLTATDEDPVKTYVGQIRATDKDVSDVVRYNCAILPDNPDWFNFDEGGVITASVVIDADAKINDLPIYDVTYNCSADDTLHYVLHNASIKIIDKNNKFPTTTTNFDEVTTKEEEPLDSVIIEFDIEDLDRDEPYHTVTCQFVTHENYDNCNVNLTVTNDNNNVQNQIHAIKNKARLDRDSGPDTYDCWMQCVDNPNDSNELRQNKLEFSVHIELIDINDNDPELVTDSLETLENIAKNDIVGEIESYDADIGNNAKVAFTIMKIENDNGEEIDDLFVLDNPVQIDDHTCTVNLIANKDLKDLYGNYIIELELRDQPDDPEEQRTFTGPLTVNVQRWNYEAPEFTSMKDGDQFVLSSDQTVGQPLQRFDQAGSTLPDIKVSTQNGVCSDKWTTTITQEQVDSAIPIFQLVEQNIDGCTTQLQITNNYYSDKLTRYDYELELKAVISSDNGREPEPDEAPYESTITIKVRFVDNLDDPEFKEPRSWSITMLEDSTTESASLTEDNKAYYPEVTEERAIFYSISSNDELVKSTFAISTNTDNTATLTLLEPLDYLAQAAYDFTIIASNSSSTISQNDNSKMAVHVEVIEINNHPPKFVKEGFFGSLVYPSSTSGTKIVTVSATDLDTIDEILHYSIVEDSLVKNGTGLSNLDEPFTMPDDTSGDIYMNFRLETTMSGYFLFSVKVEDNEDDYGNGPFNDTATVSVVILTTDYTIDFKFENPLDEVTPKTSEMEQIIGEVLGYTCNTRLIQKDTANGIDLENQTIATLYFLDELLPVKADDIHQTIADITKFSRMRSELRQQGLILMNFDADTTPKNLEGTLKMWLIIVSVTLGSLLLILMVIFIFKWRDLNQRLNKLTTQKFGSEESGLNRLGINAPTTNKHAIEGSNPVFTTEITKNGFGNKAFDESSINSGDSDLIGVEDNEEFDNYFRGTKDDTSEYI